MTMKSDADGAMRRERFGGSPAVSAMGRQVTSVCAGA